LNGHLGRIARVAQVAVGGRVVARQHGFDRRIAGCGRTARDVNGKGGTAGGGAFGGELASNMLA
jgi:hypothetical protein